MSDLTSNHSNQEAKEHVVTLKSNASINHQEWSAYQNKVFLDHERTLILIDQYVKNDMFHQLKFILRPEMMIFSWEAKSICQIICTKFNVPKNGSINFWSTYSKHIIQKLNKKRFDVSIAMKKSFKGKYMCLFLCKFDFKYQHVLLH